MILEILIYILNFILWILEKPIIKFFVELFNYIIISYLVSSPPLYCQNSIYIYP